MNRWHVVGACCALGFVAACSSSAPKVSPTVSTSAGSPSSQPASPTVTATPGAQSISIAPHTGLADGQMVRVVASGFTPGESLVVIECADKGEQTQEGDCNVQAARTVVSDAHGTVTTAFRVVVGPFGSNSVVCSRTTPCLVSVNQPVPAPTEQASLNITFA